MEKGHDLYGCVVDGYWCDIGSLGDLHAGASRRARRQGRAATSRASGRRDDVWVGEGAKIDPDAEHRRQGRHRRERKIRAGAELGEYTVIGDNCMVGLRRAGAPLGRVGRHLHRRAARHVARRGAVPRRRRARARARVEMGAVDRRRGDGRARARSIGNDVQVYPFKRIEPGRGRRLARSSGRARGVRALFGADGVVGPRRRGHHARARAAARAGVRHDAARRAATSCVSRDTAAPARMLKRAMVAGLNSAGMNVRDLRVASPAVNRFTTRDTRCVGRRARVRVADDDAQTRRDPLLRQARARHLASATRRRSSACTSGRSSAARSSTRSARSSTRRARSSTTAPGCTSALGQQRPDRDERRLRGRRRHGLRRQLVRDAAGRQRHGARAHLARRRSPTPSARTRRPRSATSAIERLRSTVDDVPGRPRRRDRRAPASTCASSPQRRACSTATRRCTRWSSCGARATERAAASPSRLTASRVVERIAGEPRARGRARGAFAPRAVRGGAAR